MPLLHHFPEGAVAKTETDTDTETDFSLRIERVLQAPRAAIWRCWTEPDLLKQWFCPQPWRVTRAEIDLRPGGRFFAMMEGPEGQQGPMAGLWREVQPMSRLVFTDAFTSAWQPSAKAFMVGDITLSDAPGGGTRYEAVARHWNAEDRSAHLAMGFEAGWNQASDQLEALARSL